MTSRTKKEYRAIIQQNFTRGLSVDECLEEMSPVFGENCPHRSTIFRWYKQFQRGKFRLEDEPRTGRPVEAVTPENIAAVEKLLNKSRRVTYRQIQELLHIGAPAVHSILHDHLHVKKVCTLWVPHVLKEEQKAHRVEWCQKMLNRFESRSTSDLNSIVTGNETWLYYYDVPTQSDSRVWLCEDEDNPVVVRKSRSIKKIIITVFFGKRGVVERVVLETECAVTSSWYTQVCLPQVISRLKKLRPGSRLDTWYFHHDNQPSYRAKDTVAFLIKAGFTVLDHPSDSPDLAPCDFGLFPEIKKRLKGRRFSSYMELLAGWDKACADIPEEAWQHWFEDWFRRMERCIECGGDYFERL